MLHYHIKGKCIRGKDTEQRNGYGLQNGIGKYSNNLARIAEQNTNYMVVAKSDSPKERIKKREYLSVWEMKFFHFQKTKIQSDGQSCINTARTPRLKP